VADSLVRTLGSKVALKPRANGSGSIVIDWHDREDFDRLVAILKGA
jgi:hypothetical protein